YTPTETQAISRNWSPGERPPPCWRIAWQKRRKPSGSQRQAGYKRTCHRNAFAGAGFLSVVFLSLHLRPCRRCKPWTSSMSTVYNVGTDEDEGTKTQLIETLRQQKHSDGTSVYTPLVAVTLMVFYVFAMQCASTVAVVRRETNSWKWPVFQWAYM